MHVVQDTFTFTDPTGTEVYVYRWKPEASEPVRGIVQISHGIMETGLRYQRIAQALAEAGYAVYANDHRGHGRTAPSPDRLGEVGEDGYNWMVRNMHQLNEIIRSEYPGLPLVLFGHSMGSALAQLYIGTYGRTVSGAILSGCIVNPGPKIHAAIYLARREIKRKGAAYRSEFLGKLTFGSYNKRFLPARTAFDWLSRDAAEVDRYVDDPLCGIPIPAQFYYYFYRGLRDTFRPGVVQGVPPELPIYLFAGDKDAVGAGDKAVRRLHAAYQRAGIRDVSVRVYPGGRHEMLNELNRDEVTADILDWLRRRF